MLDLFACREGNLRNLIHLIPIVIIPRLYSLLLVVGCGRLHRIACSGEIGTGKYEHMRIDHRKFKLVGFHLQSRTLTLGIVCLNEKCGANAIIIHRHLKCTILNFGIVGKSVQLIECNNRSLFLFIVKLGKHLPLESEQLFRHVTIIEPLLQQIRPVKPPPGIGYQHPVQLGDRIGIQILKTRCGINKRIL